ncbi:MAG: efflux RND transporter periplasmic adaptor subunit [Candidatus Binatia bacterium]
MLATAVGLLLFSWVVYLGLTWDLRKSEADPAAAFRAAKVVRGSLHETVAATGTMESVTRVEIKSEVSGIVRKLYVEEGDRVTPDQPLVELDLDRLADRVAELRAAVEARRAQAHQDVVGKALADLDQARRDHHRVARLFAQGVASSQESEDAQHKLRLAEIAVNDARAEHEARQAAILQAQAALQKAERDLEHGVLRAPIEGVVIRRDAELGTPVADMSASNGGTLVAVVADDRHLRLVAQVDENDIAHVRVGQPADVHIDAFPGDTFHGAVRKVSSAGTLDQKVANFRVELELPHEDRIRVGMSADARVVVGEHRDVLLIPNTAIVRSDDGPKVRLGDPRRSDTARLVPIREAYSDGFQTIVSDGLAEGDSVLVRGDPQKP